MVSTTRARRGAGAFVLAAAVAGSLLTVASPASAAAPAACDASALGLSLLGAPAVSPLAANPVSAPCKAESASITAPVLGTDLSAQALSASTTLASGTATAIAKVGILDIGAVNATNADVTPLTSGANSILGSVGGTLAASAGTGGAIGNALAPLKLLGLTITGVDNGQLAVDIAPKLPAALDVVLPDLVHAGLLRAGAMAVCSDGRATLSGDSTLTDVQVLGTTVDANTVAGQVLSIDTAHLTLSQIESVTTALKSIHLKATGGSVLAGIIGGGDWNLYDLLVTPGGLLGQINGQLSGGNTVGTVLSAVSAALQPVLDHTDVPLPAGVLRAVVTPNLRVSDGDTITQTTLALAVTALGQPIVSGGLATAHVNAAAAGCAPVPPLPPTPDPPRPPVPPRPVVSVDGELSGRVSSAFAGAALKCTDARLRLIDVRPEGKRTYVQGVAEKAFVGQTASIFLTYGNKKVGTAKVAADGTFSTRVALPASKIRSTNAARYYAVIMGKRTAALKFARRMFNTKLSVSGGKVTYAGYTTTPRAKRQKAVVIQERVSCTKYKNVATAKPDAKGRFSVTFTAPKNVSTAVYRAQTFVPKSTRSKKPFATYTLPLVLKLK